MRSSWALVCFNLLLIAAAALTGCSSADSGGDAAGPAHNDEVIASAQAAEQSEESIHTILKEKLKLHEYAGVTDAFTIPVGSPDVHIGEDGKECSITQILMGKDTIAAYLPSDSILVSPDGESAVHVGTFMGTDLSDCLIVVRDALGW